MPIPFFIPSAVAATSAFIGYLSADDDEEKNENKANTVLDSSLPSSLNIIKIVVLAGGAYFILRTIKTLKK